MASHTSKTSVGWCEISLKNVLSQIMYVYYLPLEVLKLYSSLRAYKRLWLNSPLKMQTHKEH